jgi:CCR4-NOT transcription complex subunit 9
MASSNVGDDDVHRLVSQLTDPEAREAALLELSKKREGFPDLALLLWHSCGTVAALLQEIIGCVGGFFFL